MNGITLHDHEVRQLSTTGKVLVVRAGKTQDATATELGVAYMKHAIKGEVAVATYRAFPGRGTAQWGLCECPFTPIGSQFFVKEAFYLPVWRTVWYRATDQITDVKWKSAMRMPESYSRFTVETESLECKRVQEITFQECVDAGHDMPMKELVVDVFDLQKRDVISEWDHRNPKQPWASNPWCWFCILKLVKDSARPLNSQT